MKRIFLLICILFAVVCPLVVQANQHHDCCQLPLTGIDSVRYQRFLEGAAKASALKVKSIKQNAVANAVPSGIIHNSGEVYQFRVALCITPEVLDEFQNEEGVVDKQRVYDWWSDTEAELNEYYRRDVGIELKVVKDDRLIMFENTTGYEIRKGGAPIADSGTPIVDALIGVSNYDVGLLITKATGSLNGAASLGGASSPYRKASGFSISAPKTIAHEMGHLFGANHTHQRYDADYTEPGQGQSIMSYGDPRTFFSVSSIRSMRNLVRNLNVYTNPERTDADFSRNTDTLGTNIVYAYPEQGVQPVLDRDLLQKEYVITQGSNFQFYLPLTNAAALSSEMSAWGQPLYCAHGFDLATELSNNALQPAVKPTANECVMFHKQWRNPASLVPNAPENDWIEPYTDASRVGRFRFALAIHQSSIYDSEQTLLRIIEGQPFIANITSPSNSTLFRWGRDFTVEWTPQTELYGDNSRVCIRLSTDYGQTFPYILADNLPNNGMWEGAFPFISIGRVPYNNFFNNVAGGIIKVEIIGEAVYALTNYNLPYYWNGNEYTVSGGFSLNQSEARYLFREVDTGFDAPIPYVKVTDRSEIPTAIPQLEAYRSTNTSKTYSTTFSEMEEGRILRRTWTANVDGTNYTYTQIFELPAIKSADAAMVKQMRDVAAELTDLVQHYGQIGYPQPDVESYRTIKSCYSDVYDAGGHLRLDYDDVVAQQLLAALVEIRQIDDTDIVFPTNGHYLLRSYQAPPAAIPYFYYTREAGESGIEKWTYIAENATELEVIGENGQYLIRDMDGRLPYLDGMTNTYDDFLLHRGYTWGSFTLLNHTLWQAQLSRNGNTFSLNYHYANSPENYRCNNNDNMIISTDFQLVPIDEENSTTAIPSSPFVLPCVSDSAIYDLNGRRIINPSAKGLYIIDGKLVVKKGYSF